MHNSFRSKHYLFKIINRNKLKNASAICQRKMDNIFKDLKYFTCVYIDDILVFSK